MKDNKELALVALKVLSDKKASDISLIDISLKASFADYLIVSTGQSERFINSLADYVEDALAANGLYAKSIEGKQNSGWILMDFGDIIVNIFTKESRAKYNIDKVWGDCPKEDYE